MQKEFDVNKVIEGMFSYVDDDGCEMVDPRPVRVAVPASQAHNLAQEVARLVANELRVRAGVEYESYEEANDFDCEDFDSRTDYELEDFQEIDGNPFQTSEPAGPSEAAAGADGEGSSSGGSSSG